MVRSTQPIVARSGRRYQPAIGPRLRWVLHLVLILFGLLGLNAVYLAAVTTAEWITGRVFQGYFYQYMFLIHLLLGALIVLPVVVFGVKHMIAARDRPNKRAARVGYALFATALVLLFSGLVLTRIESIIDVRSVTVRQVAYWLHVLTPLVAIWLFILHRLAGPRIKWRVGIAWAGVAGAFALAMVGLHMQDPRQWNVAGPESGEQYFFPSLARTDTGKFIPANVLMNDKYCMKCHQDTHKSWFHSMHHFSSFNNPAYEASVLQTRKAMHERHGNVQGARFCAGCHDPVPFFSGAFDDPKFDDPAYDLKSDPMAQAGITCTSCHAITHINSPRGNADYTIEEPLHYPFAFSDNPTLAKINELLVKAKPAFHKKTFLKPLHKSTEFCGTCHKVHLPVELNDYKWLRGQNHYDAFLLSGVSGHGVASFYYPPKAETNCNNCHMPKLASHDFGARLQDNSGQPKIHDHQFPSANTAIPAMTDMPDWVNENHRAFLKDALRLDIFALHEGSAINGPLIAPLRPNTPKLAPGKEYLIDVVIRTVKMGHTFTQGTADSNEVWLDLAVYDGDKLIGRSGGLNEAGEVYPWSHFVNAFVLDREGNRIDRRNAEDIFVPLYNHQIPPGAADVVHYRLKVPDDARGPVVVKARLNYRKFDTTYLRFFTKDPQRRNDLPITLLAEDKVTLAITGGTAKPNPASPIVLWQRWNDYGIGLLRKGDQGPNRGELRQAEYAFKQVAMLGQPDGAMNLARLYLKEGRLAEAGESLRTAAKHDPPAPPWSVAWFGGLVSKQNTQLDDAIASFRSLATMDTDETRKRRFDFSKDYNLLNELGQTLIERSKQEQGPAAKEPWLREAADWYNRTLTIDPENAAAHHNLALIYSLLDDAKQTDHHRALHGKYKMDDNARGRAITQARRKYPHADHAAEAIVIWDLHRPDAYKLTDINRTTPKP